MVTGILGAIGLVGAIIWGLVGYGAFGLAKTIYEGYKGEKVTDADFQLALKKMKMEEQASIRVGQERTKLSEDTMQMTRSMMAQSREDANKQLQLGLGQQNLEREKDFMQFASERMPKPYFGSPLSPDQLLQYLSRQ